MSDRLMVRHSLNGKSRVRLRVSAGLVLRFWFGFRLGLD